MDMQKHRFLHIHISTSKEESRVAGVAYGSVQNCLKLQCIMRESVTDVSRKIHVGSFW